MRVEFLAYESRFLFGLQDVTPRRRWGKTNTASSEAEPPHLVSAARGGASLVLGKTKRIHFVGIGGIGMSGIAELLTNLGYKVSGSDARRSESTDR